jgi:hypothetical protein
VYELNVSLLSLVLMVTSYWFGVVVQRRLREVHRSRESVDSIRVVITLLVTFAAVVLGLVISASQARFSAAGSVLRGLSIDITELDQRLRDYGPELDPLRAQLIRYTEVAIVDLWPNETPPPGNYASDVPLARGEPENLALGGILQQIDLAIRRLTPDDAFRQSIVAVLKTRVAALQQQRWDLVVSEAPALPGWLVAILLFWLVVIFVIAGVSSPLNIVVAMVTMLAAISLASSIFLGLELDTPLSGFIKVSSEAMRGALQHITEPPLPAGAP